MKKLLLIFSAFVILGLNCRADEGMWIPLLLKKYTIADMQKQGFKLTAEDIYHINQASLKDAVIGLGKAETPFHHFCTAELISSEGLAVTNHHCAFGMIQAHSSLEYNYLRDGFWARQKNEELVNPGVTASVLVRMEDVTDQINAVLTAGMSEQERQEAIRQKSHLLQEEAVKGTHLVADIKAYFNGNQFFMSVYKIYKDVRLVGAPPSSIGKFGGDTDNWMWPRHTGDFSFLRIYAGADNEPAEYAPDNRPYQPDYSFPISVKGGKEGDFTMVFGYPGTTNEYLTSYAVSQILNIENPHRIEIRTAKLDIINAAMNSDELLRIKYAAKAASVANAWKKWQGENKGLARFKTIEKKEERERNFQKWTAENPEYAEVLSQYKQLYEKRQNYILAAVYAKEAGKNGAEIINFISTLTNILQNQVKSADWECIKTQMLTEIRSFYKDYDVATDQKILAEMLRLYAGNIQPEWRPSIIPAEGYKTYAESAFHKSIFTDSTRLITFVSKLSPASYKKFEKDPLGALTLAIDRFNKEHIVPELNNIDRNIAQLDRIWLAGLMKMEPTTHFYADANSTLRVAYGKIGGYSPADAVYYTPYTTLKGILEKDNPDIYDYNIPQELRDLYLSGDFGEYTQDGEVPVCFIANNHTTGGNSGSPVLNAEGQLIGINFDRAWDGIMSDIQYDPDICRNIAVDIRYVLFITDKLAGAGYLLREMNIVR